MSRRALLSATLLSTLLSAAGCGGTAAPGGFGVDLTLTLTPAARATVKTVQLHVSGAETYDVPPLAIRAFPGGVARVHYIPGVTAGTIAFDASGLDANALAVATGTSGAVTLAAGKAVFASITLGEVGAPADLSAADQAPADLALADLAPADLGLADLTSGVDAPPSGPPTLAFNHQPTYDFGAVLLGAKSSPATLIVSNGGGTATSALGAATLSGAHAAAYKIVTDGCAGQTLAAGASCTITVVLGPQSTLLSAATATLTVSATLGGSATVGLTGAIVTSGYTLAIANVGAGAGDAVTSTPLGDIDCGNGSTMCSRLYPPANPAPIVTLTPVAGAHSRFVGFSGSDCSGASCVLTMNADHTTVTANWTATYDASVTLAGGGGGKVTSASSPPFNCTSSTCTLTFDADTSVTLTATSDGSSSFQGWSGGCSGKGTCVLSSASSSAIATFTANVVLTVAQNNAGAATGSVTSGDGAISCSQSCQVSYALGSQVDLIATPAAGYYFGGWSGGGCGLITPCTVTLNSAATVFARFTPANYVFNTAATYAIGDLVANATSGVTNSEKAVSGANKLCNSAGAKLSAGGKFVAFLSSPAQSAASVIPTTARGWIRADGLPFMDRFVMLSEPWYPASPDENGATLGTNDATWTMSNNSSGGYDPNNCVDYTIVDGSHAGLTGSRSGGEYSWAGTSTQSCNAPSHLMCFQTDYSAIVFGPPAPAHYTYIFAAPNYDTSTGLKGADAACATAATAAGLPGSYMALLPTNKASALSRFTLHGQPVVRPDFVQVATLDTDMQSAAWIARAPLTDATGRYAGGEQYLVGAATVSAKATAATQTCSDWTTTTGNALGGNPGSAVQIFDYLSFLFSCGTSTNIYCMGQ